MPDSFKKFNELCTARNEPVAYGTCENCTNAIFSIEEVNSKRLSRKEKLGRLYQDYWRLENENYFTLLYCYCSLMHSFIDEIKTDCDGKEEQEPEEI